MRILVTGGAGYVGSVLVTELLAAGHDVVVLERFRYGLHGILAVLPNPRLNVFEGDVRCEQDVTAAARGCDAIIHLAAVVGAPACAAEPYESVSTNVDGTRTVCLAAGRRPKLFASTCSVYGRQTELCDEQTALSPVSIYASSKSDGERIARECGAVCLRFGTLFGISPRMRTDLLVNDLVWQAIWRRHIVLYEAGARRAVLHVRDAAAAYGLALERVGELEGRVLNVGSDELNLTKSDLVAAIVRLEPAEVFESPAGIDPDRRDYRADFNNIRQLGFAPRVAIEDGVEELRKLLRLLPRPEVWRNY